MVAKLEQQVVLLKEHIKKLENELGRTVTVGPAPSLFARAYVSNVTCLATALTANDPRVPSHQCAQNAAVADEFSAEITTHPWISTINAAKVREKDLYALSGQICRTACRNNGGAAQVPHGVVP